MCSMIFLASPGLSSSESDNEDGSGPQSKVPRLLSTRRKWSGTPGSGVASRRPAVKIAPRPATQNIVHKLWNREVSKGLYWLISSIELLKSSLFSNLGRSTVARTGKVMNCRS